MLFSAVAAVTLGFAATGEALDQGSAQRVWEDFELREQKVFALAQGQGGFARGGVYPCYIYGKDIEMTRPVNEKESALKMRKCSMARPYWL